jgi:hypothetical protein
LYCASIAAITAGDSSRDWPASGSEPRAQHRDWVVTGTLMASVLAPLAGRAVTLYATEADIALYRSFGFVTTAMVLTHQGHLREAPPLLSALDEPVRAATTADLDSMVRLDEAATGAPRCELLSALLPCATGVVLERGGVPRGFAMLRRFGRGFFALEEKHGRGSDRAMRWSQSQRNLAFLAAFLCRADVGSSPRWLRRLTITDNHHDGCGSGALSLVYCGRWSGGRSWRPATRRLPGNGTAPSRGPD